MQSINLEKISPIIAALVYGGWGAYSNLEFGPRVFIAAGLAQGAFAFLSTWGLARLVHILIHHGRQRMQQTAAQLSAFAGGSGVLITVPALMHLAAGTQSILMAMLPGLVIGHCYLGLLIYRQKIK